MRNKLVNTFSTICVLVLAGAAWAQSAVSGSSKSSPKSFRSSDGTFRITYPDRLIRCERVHQENDISNSYLWKQEGCSAYIPPCSNADDDDQPVLCLAYPPKQFAHNPTFDAAVLTVWELNWSKEECMADGEHPLKSIAIRGVKFKGGRSDDAAMNHLRESKNFAAYHNGKCYALTITTVTTNGAGFDTPVKDLTKLDWEKVYRPLKQARDSFQFLK